jgi:SAM-dependent methyltransferase
MTILRKAEHAALRVEKLSGSVLDLGGHPRSEYAALFQGTFKRTTANLSPDADIRCDFEEPLPIASASYDAVLLVNVLEHIFEYRQLLGEAARILRPHGHILIVVPFLFPYHASPQDYHRYTASALTRALSGAGFSDITVVALGSGVCAARWLFIERLLPAPLRPLSLIAVPLTALGDRLLFALARALGKKYDPADYAIGFKATART